MARKKYKGKRVKKNTPDLGVIITIIFLNRKYD